MKLPAKYAKNANGETRPVFFGGYSRVSRALLFFVLASVFSASAADFFTIKSVKLLSKESKDGVGVWAFAKVKKTQRPSEFQPCLEVVVGVKEDTRSERTVAKAYFFDEGNKLMAALAKPSKAGGKRQAIHYEMPVLFSKEGGGRFFFGIPAAVKDRKWKAVVVFGDKAEMKSQCWPGTESDFLLDYPEKALVQSRKAGTVERKPAINPLVEHAVKTPDPKVPRLTLFLRPPKGVTEGSEIRGVLTICVLSNSLESVRRDMQKEEMSGDYQGLFGFANANKLAIIAWGAPGVWNANANYDDLSREKAREVNAALTTVADAWERGVRELARKYGIPEKNYLLWGACGSAQWAHRLCLRKPEYFLAIAIHIPGSFDKPTPGASKVLWCLTTGDLYGGYERSRRFYAECQELGYPMVYKVIIGLGHAGHPVASALGFEFFRHALALKEEREKYDRESAKAVPGTTGPPQPWPESFRNPPYYGDILSQMVHRAEKVGRIAPKLRTPLPTKEIARVWERSE